MMSRCVLCGGEGASVTYNGEKFHPKCFRESWKREKKSLMERFEDFIRGHAKNGVVEDPMRLVHESTLVFGNNPGWIKWLLSQLKEMGVIEIKRDASGEKICEIRLLY